MLFDIDTLLFVVLFSAIPLVLRGSTEGFVILERKPNTAAVGAAVGFENAEKSAKALLFSPPSPWKKLVSKRLNGIKLQLPKKEGCGVLQF